MDFVTGTPKPESLKALIESFVNFLLEEIDAGRFVFKGDELVPAEEVEKIKEAEN